MSTHGDRRVHYQGGTSAVRQHSGAVQPRYLGSVEAVAAAHAGRDVLISRVFLDDGTPAIKVELPPTRQAAGNCCGHHCGGHQGQHGAVYGDGPYYPGPAPGHNPRHRPAHTQDEVEQVPARPPMFTNFQKTIIIVGVVIVVVLLALYLLLKLVMAVWATLVAVLATILGFGVVILVAWVILGSGGGGGGGGGGGITNISTTITAKTINVGRIIFGR